MNAVAPGIIFSKTAADNYNVDVFSMAEPFIPAKRVGTPQEVCLFDKSNTATNNKRALHFGHYLRKPTALKFICCLHFVDGTGGRLNVGGIKRVTKCRYD